MPRSIAILVGCCLGLLALPCPATYLRRSHRSAEHVQLAPDSKEMPRIMYGTAWKEENTTELVKEALSLGFKGIDTANQPLHYREDLVGLAIEQFLAENKDKTRTSIFLQTKFSPYQSMESYSKELIPYSAEAPIKQQVRQSISKSLTNLRTSYIDSVVLHSPMKSLEDNKQVWSVLETFVKEGKIKKLGFSNIYDLQLLKMIHAWATVKPTVVQNHFVWQECFDVEIRQWCSENNVKYQSFWTLTGNSPAVASPPVKQIANNRGMTPEQVWYLWVMREGVVPLIGAQSSNHMQQDLALLNKPKLTDEEHDNVAKYIEQRSKCKAIRIK